MNKKTKRLIMLNAPYVLIGLLATNLGEAWRLAIGSNATEKVQALVQTIPQALSNPLPSLHPFDLMVEKVVIHEAEGGRTKDRTQQVDIYFNFIGNFVLPLSEDEVEALQSEEARRA